MEVDGGWRLTGQKVWTSVADRADWGWVTEFLDAPPVTTPTQPTGPWLVIGTPTDERVCDILAALRAEMQSLQRLSQLSRNVAGPSCCLVSQHSLQRS